MCDVLTWRNTFMSSFLLQQIRRTVDLSSCVCSKWQAKNASIPDCIVQATKKDYLIMNFRPVSVLKSSLNLIRHNWPRQDLTSRSVMKETTHFNQDLAGQIETMTAYFYITFNWILDAVHALGTQLCCFSFEFPFPQNKSRFLWSCSRKCRSWNSSYTRKK